MSYTPTEWQPDDIVTAARMNALETAVGEMNMSYTPNTWVNGDVITAAKMNALEQAVASGGGGSSDFSTAEVTFINYVNGWVRAAICLDLGNIKVSVSEGLISDSPETVTICMYGGMANMTLDYDDATTTGDISNDGDYNYTITGDGTITIS